MQKVASLIIKLEIQILLEHFFTNFIIYMFTCSAAAGNLSNIDRAALSLRHVRAAANGVRPVRSLLVRSMDG